MSSLIFWGTYPEWLKNGSFTQDELKAIVENRIRSTITHFKDQASIWIVVNSFHPARWGGEDFLRDQLGLELLDLAFQAARESDPSATLLYNDINNHSPNPDDVNGSITQNTLQIVSRLKEKGLIDGVGLQMHL